MSIINSIWERFGGKKLVVILAVFAGYLTGSVPENVFHDGLLFFFGAQGIADLAAYWGSKAKEKVGLAPKTAKVEKATVTDTQDTPSDKPDFGE